MKRTLPKVMVIYKKHFCNTSGDRWRRFQAASVKLDHGTVLRNK